jgi:hypothetical protein
MRNRLTNLVPFFAVVQNVEGETRLHHKSVPHAMHWSNVFAARAAELGEARPELAAAVEPLLKAREAVERQIADLDRKVAASHRRISRCCSSAGRAQSRHFSL